jgi:hypothetical protein
VPPRLSGVALNFIRKEFFIMEKEIGISFPGSSLSDSAFYNESYSNEEDEFVQEFTLIEALGLGILATYLGAIGTSIFKTCAGGKRVYKFTAKMVEATKNKDSKAAAKYLYKLVDALDYASRKASLVNSEKEQLALTSHIGYALWYCMRNPSTPFIKETTALFEKYMESCLKILAKPSKGRTPETVNLDELTKEPDDSNE